MRTQAVEDYLKTIYEIEQEQGRVGTSALAERLRVTPGSVTGMIKKLAGTGLVTHEPYRGVVLTDAGQKIALKVVRQHRLVELFLVRKLGVPWDRVHKEAHRIEHVLSDYLEDRMDVVLGHPTTDPHGAPIPSRNGTIRQVAHRRLTELEPGQKAIVSEVSDHDSSLLRHLDSLGILPGTEVTVVEVAPHGGSLTVRTPEGESPISPEAARHIFVRQSSCSAQEVPD
jgi:DtxR family Mn-dependent transcriptional regulator